MHAAEIDIESERERKFLAAMQDVASHHQRQASDLSATHALNGRKRCPPRGVAAHAFGQPVCAPTPAQLARQRAGLPGPTSSAMVCVAPVAVHQVPWYLSHSLKPKERKETKCKASASLPNLSNPVTPPPILSRPKLLVHTHTQD